MRVVSWVLLMVSWMDWMMVPSMAEMKVGHWATQLALMKVPSQVSLMVEKTVVQKVEQMVPP